MDDKPQDDSKQTPQLPNSQELAANVARAQLEQAYKNDPPNQPKDEQKKSPYDRTHRDNFDWREYHSAWQTYYQEYYRRYYQHIHAKKGLNKPVDEVITGDDSQRVEALKKDVLTQVQRSAKSIKHSHHFWPIVSALAVGFVFLFVQFNSVMLAQVQAYVSPGALEGQSLVITDPTSNVSVGPESRLIIPKINVDVPINYDVGTLDENVIQTALRDAAVHYKLPGADALPGQFGNNVILGHSSNDVFAPGQYKFAFVLTDHLVAGDTFYLHFKGIRYTYKVTNKKTIKPNELATLQVGYDKPMTTLVTCTPPGTSINRLLIFAEQINPDPTAATKPTQPAETPALSQQDIPGNAPTLFEQIWKFFF